MQIYAQPGDIKYLNVAAEHGLLGTIGVKITNAAGTSTVSARTTSGITEPDSDGNYVVAVTAPDDLGDYRVLVDDGAGNTTLFELSVTGATAITLASDGSAYITSSDLEATLSLTGTTYAGPDIALAVQSGSRIIDGICRRRFWLDDANVDRVYTPTMATLVRIADLAVPHTVTKGTTVLVEGTDFVYQPRNAPADGYPYEWIELLSGRFRSSEDVTVNGKWGWSAVPTAIADATSIVAAMLVMRKRQAPFGMVTSFDTGLVARLAKNDPQVAALIGDYIRQEPWLM